MKRAGPEDPPGMKRNPSPAGNPLSPEDLQRYSRQMVLAEIGETGQARLKAASVLVVGTGGLGSPVAIYLAAGGVGRLGLVDYDVVDASNLQRQIIHATPDVGRPKLESARRTLRGINPLVNVDTYDTRLCAGNAREILKPFDLVVDCSDNFATRYLVNDACVLLGKPNVYGSIFRFEGQASVFDPARGPCYRCLYPEPPPAEMVPPCSAAGVLGVLPGLVGLIQATEAIKLILGKGDLLIGRLLLVDALEMRFREMKVHKDPHCAACGKHPKIRELADLPEYCSHDAPADPHTDISAAELRARLGGAEDLVLIDVREPGEFQLGYIHGARLVPLGELKARLQELDPKARVVVYCRSGHRSDRAAKLLREAGFTHVRNLEGSILAWGAV